MKLTVTAAAVLLTLLMVYTAIKWDSSPPAADWQHAPPTVGNKTRISLEIRDEGKGLRLIEINLVRGGRRHPLITEVYPATWIWQEGVKERSMALSPEKTFGKDLISEGKFQLEVRLRDQPNLWIWSREVVERRPFELDLTPPSVRAVSTQHYVRQGGSEAVAYHVSGDVVESGVTVGEHRFRGYPMQGTESYLCLFALPHDEPEDSPIFLWAVDTAGNEGSASFWVKTIPVRFRSRKIRLSDSLINSVVPKIIARTDEISQQSTTLDTFLQINGRLRELNHNRIAEIARESRGQLLWSEPFLQLSQSQVESAFADRRTYLYNGKQVDRQTHLGFDLASLAQSPVEAANAGIVVFASYLGIYGNCVVVDHGLGLLSFYGHLSQIEVTPGQSVKRGQALGRTGQTGLAAGDHLHFSIILQGVQVNPLEWWDPNWVENHILSRVRRSTPTLSQSFQRPPRVVMRWISDLGIVA